MMLIVTRPLEQAALEVPGIRRVRSKSIRGATEISAQFDPATDMVIALQMLQNRVAEIRGDHVVGIEEKPRAPKSNFAVIGIYLYDATVFQKIRRLKPSGRGELEITDVNNFYIEENKLTYEVLNGWWTDAGTFESLLRANNLVAETGANKMAGNPTSARQEVNR